jgi:hypothetical protein
MNRLRLLLLGLTTVGAFAVRAELPPLIPREILFGNPACSQPQISPDGDQIAWLAPDQNDVVNVWISSIGGRAEPWKKVAGATAEVR